MPMRRCYFCRQPLCAGFSDDSGGGKSENEMRNVASAHKINRANSHTLSTSAFKWLIRSVFSVLSGVVFNKLATRRSRAATSLASAEASLSKKMSVKVLGPPGHFKLERLGWRFLPNHQFTSMKWLTQRRHSKRMWTSAFRVRCKAVSLPIMPLYDPFGQSELRHIST